MTQISFRRLCALILPLAATLLVAGCEDQETAHANDAKQLRLAYGWYPTCFDYAQSNPFALFGRQVVDTLLSQNSDTGALEPYLAERWRTLEDGRIYEFTIRDGVTFSNGEALSADVVAKNFQTLWRLAEEGVAPTVGAYLRGFERIEVVDSRTVRVVFREPNAGFLQANTEGQFGIVASETLSQTPEKRCQKGVIGSGPFVLDRAIQDERIEYVRREDYDWAPKAFGRKGPASLERVTIQIVPEESLRAAGVLNGEYDLAYSITKTGLAQAKGRDTVRVVTAPNRGVVNSFVVNTADPILSDRAVRQAIQRGINRSELATTFYGDGVEAASDIVSSGHPFYSDHSDLLAYDPELARRLLDKAGWAPGADGIRTKGNRPLEIGLTFVNGTIGSVESGWEYIQSQLAALGIRLELHPVSTAEQNDIRASNRWQLAVFQGASRGDADGIAAFYSTDYSVWKGQAPRPDVDRLLARQSFTADPQQRRSEVDDAVHKILDEGYGIPLFDSAQVLLVSSEVGGLTFPLNSWEPILYRVEKIGK